MWNATKRLGRIVRWKASGFFLGFLVPGITISYIRNGELDVHLRADGMVVMTDAQGTKDALPITFINPAVAIDLINAQQWPWQKAVSLNDLQEAG